MQASAAGAAEQRGELEGGGVDDDGEPPLLTDRGDPADDVAGGALGGGGLGHDRLLAADGGGERLEVKMTADRHDADRERSAVHRRHQRLEHPLGRNAERGAGLKAERVGPGVVRVLVQGERDLGPIEGDGRGGASGSHEGHSTRRAVVAEIR